MDLSTLTLYLTHYSLLLHVVIGVSYQVRMAALDAHRFHWIECLDEEQSLKPYYYNTVTQVIDSSFK